MDYQALEKNYSFEVYPKRDITITRGSGATLWDQHGRAYIDCTAGVGVANVGHANPQVAAAISEQAKRLITCAGVFHNDVRARLMQKLIEISPAGLEHVFLCNSGTEANEAAIKFARHTTGRTGFVCAMRGFHGRTMGALSATHKHRNDFEPLLPGFRFVPFNNFEKLHDAVDDNTAAVMLEIVQGEGGVRLGDREYFQRVQRLCRERGVLLIIDEIQTGFCRTGTLFACEHFALQPDLLCLAKAMAGGVPMGAVLCSAAVQPQVGIHGSTFGGNPLACAAANAAIGFMQEQLLHQQARDKGDYFANLRDWSSLPSVRELRHIGLMIGLELKTKAKPVILALMENGVLALPAGATVVRLLPPLVITHAQLDTVANALEKVLSDA